MDASDIVLLADLGGTNSRFQLLRGCETLKLAVLPTAQATSFIEIARSFLQDAPAPVVAVIGTAGYVYQNTARFFNQARYWDPITCSGEEAAQALGLRKVLFLNDFVVAAHGCLETPESELLTLNSARRHQCAPIVVMGPGTGLGVCYMTWNGHEYDAWATEGGHADFAAHSELQ